MPKSKSYTIKIERPDASLKNLKQVLMSQFANQHRPTAHTKERDEKRGGGRKPWRQKGTGRARHGSIRSPLWSGGGTTFGPRKERNFKKDINQKSARVALWQALALLSEDDKVFELEETPRVRKTKSLMGFLATVSDEEGDWLIVGNDFNETFRRSSNNIPFVELEYTDNLSVADLATKSVVIFLPEAFDSLAERINLDTDAIHRNTPVTESENG